jgi:hypothetical protein
VVMDIIHVSELSNKELFRTILNSLWIEYDHGGISVGRSYQASLIEGFMDFFTVSSHYRLLEGDLLRAAEMRIEEFSPYRPDWIQMEIPFSEMSVLSVEEFKHDKRKPLEVPGFLCSSLYIIRT